MPEAVLLVAAGKAQAQRDAAEIAAALPQGQVERLMADRAFEVVSSWTHLTKSDVELVLTVARSARRGADFEVPPRASKPS